MNSLLKDKSRPDLFKVTPRETIGEKLFTFYEKMNAIAAFLKENGAPPEIQIKPEEIYLECYIDKPAVARLITIAMQDDFAQFGLFFGLEDPVTQDPEEDPSSSFGRLTACFL